MHLFQPLFLDQNGHVFKKFTESFGERNFQQQDCLRP